MTWPPGDSRGHWSALFDLYGRLIAQGHKLNVPDAPTRVHAEKLAREPERVLDARDQAIVAETIGLMLRDDFEGRIGVYAGAVERTHMHLLFGEMRFDIDYVVGRIKSRTSSAVIRDGSESGRARTWTTGFWKVFVFDDRAIPIIQNYIEDHNVRRGLARAPYGWITPFDTSNSPGHARG